MGLKIFRGGGLKKVDFCFYSSGLRIVNQQQYIFVVYLSLMPSYENKLAELRTLVRCVAYTNESFF